MRCLCIKAIPGALLSKELFERGVIYDYALGQDNGLLYILFRPEQTKRPFKMSDIRFKKHFKDIKEVRKEKINTILKINKLIYRPKPVYG
jgi:hypothetical protein